MWGRRSNIEQIKKIQNVKNTLNTLGLDPVTMFAIGGVVDVIKRSPYVCAWPGHRHGNNSTAPPRVAMPRGSDGMAPLAAMFLPADDRGTLPMLQPPRVLSSTSYFLDLGKFWEDRDKILTPEQAKSMDKFRGPDRHSILRAWVWGPCSSRRASPITSKSSSKIPDKAPYKIKPGVASGSFAVVLDMRDPGFAKSMGTILRGAALAGGFQYGLKMVEEKHGRHTLVTYYFPESYSKVRRRRQQQLPLSISTLASPRSAQPVRHCLLARIGRKGPGRLSAQGNR